MSKIVIFASLLIYISGTHGSYRSVDPNRLRITSIRNDQNKSLETFVNLPSNYQNDGVQYSPRQHTTRRRSRYDRRSLYSHNVPVVIKAPEQKLYTAKEHPAEFYKNETRPYITWRRYRSKDGSITTTTAPMSMIDINKKYKNSYYTNDIRREEINQVKPKKTIRTLKYNDVSVYKPKYHPEVHKPRLCLRCPSERTVIAAKGLERVILDPPQLVDCSGNPAPERVHFKGLYGPNIGNLLREGTHVIVGALMDGNTKRHLCQYRMNVIVRRCEKLQTSPNVITFCPKDGAWGTMCRFKCNTSNLLMVLNGPKKIKCGDDLEWTSDPPSCAGQSKVGRTWCESPLVPKFGRLNCDTSSGSAPPTGFPEGSTCSITCIEDNVNDAFDESFQPSLVCEEGSWNGEIPICRKPRRKRHSIKKKFTN